MMKVLMAQDSFLPLIGGAEIHVLKLACTLKKRGHQVQIVTATPGASLVDDLQVWRYPCLQGGGKQAIFRLWVCLPSIVRLIRSHEIIHGHYSFFLSAILAVLCRILRHPFVVTLHGLGTLDSSVQGFIFRRFWRFLSLRLAAHVIATSSEMAEVARRFTSEERITVIPNAVDVEYFADLVSFYPPYPPFRILVMRRLVPKNGVQYLVEAAPIILKRLKDVEFWVVGDGRMRPYLEQLAKELGVYSHFRFWGMVSNEQVREFLHDAHVVVFPSSAESTSIAALEAMAAGRPVVASAVGAYPELLGDNERGILVRLFDRDSSDYNAPLTLPPERVHALAEAVLTILQEPDLAKQLTQNALSYVRQYHDWSVITSRIEEIYERVFS